MSEKHTQGPWAYLPEECDKPYIRIRGTMLGGRYKIANVITPFYEGVHEREAKETRCNARLIAESPVMFDLLEKVLPLVAFAYAKGHADAEIIGRDIEVAIEKVKGAS